MIEMDFEIARIESLILILAQTVHDSLFREMIRWTSSRRYIRLLQMNLESFHEEKEEITSKG